MTCPTTAAAYMWVWLRPQMEAQLWTYIWGCARTPNGGSTKDAGSTSACQRIQRRGQLHSTRRAVFVCVRVCVCACVTRALLTSRVLALLTSRAHLDRRGHRAPTYLERIVARTPPLSLATHGHPPPKSRPGSSLGAGPPTSTGGLSPFKGTSPATPATPGGEVREEWGGAGQGGHGTRLQVFPRACSGFR